MANSVVSILRVRIISSQVVLGPEQAVTLDTTKFFQIECKFGRAKDTHLMVGSGGMMTFGLASDCAVSIADKAGSFDYQDRMLDKLLWKTALSQ